MSDGLLFLQPNKLITMKNNTTNKNASGYFKEVLKFFARTTAFGIVGFIKYNRESADTGAILYDLTQKTNKKKAG
jgi:hypothetical protein